MKVKLTNRNQITIPRSLVKKLNLKPGTEFDLEEKDYELVISIKLHTEKEVQKPTKSSPKTKTISKTKKAASNKIVSNIEDLDKYNKPKLSPCKLVVRTKNSYIKQFCDRCKGELATNNEECPYKVKPKKVSKKSANKQIIDKLVDNVAKLNKQIDAEIKETSLSDNTVMEIVANKDFMKCNGCDEFFNKGMKLDYKFYCIPCAKKDFIKYMEKRKTRKRGK